MGNIKRTKVSVGVALLLGLAVTGAMAWNSHAVSPVLANPLAMETEQVQNEEGAPKVYRDYAEGYSEDLPPGREIELDFSVVHEASYPGDSSVGVNEVYTDSYIESKAAFAWLCQWEAEAVSAHSLGDSEGFEFALNKVASFLELEWSQEHFIDPENLWYSNVVEPALGGDISGLQRDLQEC